ncbi:MAG: peptidylprolyl isomerase [Spirochaetes bacterium]|jgi:FKBP-type peptidyl-prolyl cis-trans isomerase SlyD|nr:peptidylprolyl isomerase [Spirochaetota bacterium]
MTVKENAVVSMEYNLTDNEGNVIDTTKDRAVFSYIHGAGMIIKGLESELTGKNLGDKFSVELSPDDAYGPVNDQMIQNVPIEQLSGIENLQQGMQLQVQSGEMSHIVTVAEIGEKEVTIDGNHPLAGVPLKFDVEVVDVRDATAEELDSGQVN